MSRLKVVRDVLFVLAITVAGIALLHSSSVADQGDAESIRQALAACEGLSCNDRGDCGTWCFCNNPTDTTGKCYKDEPAIESFLESQK